MIVLVAVLVAVVLAVIAASVIGRRRARPVGARIDPFTIGEPWRRHVAAAQAAQRRYLAAVATVPSGPLRERLEQIGTKVQRGVGECWQIARRGDELDDALRRIDAPSIDRQIERATNDSAREALQAQRDAGARVRATRDDADERLRTLNTRLGELAAEAAEVSVGADTTDQLGSSVDDVVTELEALRLAIDDVNRAGGSSPAT